MRANNVLGLIYSNAYDSALPEITAMRTMGSVPFCGRYRMIDFALSNFVNSGITKIGVATKSNYQSLMDHLGTGKPWDLSRKSEGMYILPPFSSQGSGGFASRMEALHGSMSFIRRSTSEYAVMCDCNVACNIDLEDLLDKHSKSDADITIAYTRGKVPKLIDLTTLEMDENGTVISAPVYQGGDYEAAYSLNIFVMRKHLLESLINEAASLHFDNFERDIIQRSLIRLNVKGYEVRGFTRTIDSLKSYFDISMELLNPDNRKALFNPERPVLTKVHDDVPAIYGLGSSVRNSLVADGCVIDGEVENSVLFRGARVAKGAKVKNSIVMQNSFVSDGASLNYTVMDKGCVITPHKTLSGDSSFPIYIGKGIVV